MAGTHYDGDSLNRLWPRRTISMTRPTTPTIQFKVGDKELQIFVPGGEQGDGIDVNTMIKLADLRVDLTSLDAGDSVPITVTASDQANTVDLGGRWKWKCFCFAHNRFRWIGGSGHQGQRIDLWDHCGCLGNRYRGICPCLESNADGPRTRVGVTDHATDHGRCIGLCADSPRCLKLSRQRGCQDRMAGLGDGQQE